jgi:hypothetical protein
MRHQLQQRSAQLPKTILSVFAARDNRQQVNNRFSMEQVKVGRVQKQSNILVQTFKHGFIKTSEAQKVSPVVNPYQFYLYQFYLSPFLSFSLSVPPCPHRHSSLSLPLPAPNPLSRNP